MIFIIGVPRSGTTSLAHYISNSHNKKLIYKELNFYAKDIISKYNLDSLQKDYVKEDNHFVIPKSYHNYIKQINENKIKMDCSPIYLFSKNALDNISKIKKKKLIVILRNPHERKLSQIKLFKNLQIYKNLNDLQKTFWLDIVNHYDSFIDNWVEKNDEILIICHEKINSISVKSHIDQFLNINTSNLIPKFNSSSLIRKFIPNNIKKYISSKAIKSHAFNLLNFDKFQILDRHNFKEKNLTSVYWNKSLESGGAFLCKRKLTSV